MNQDTSIPESRIHVVDHPLITSILGFLEFKFGGDNIASVRIETQDSPEEISGWKVSLSFGEMIPEDMMIPGYSVLWREEFLVVLEQADEEKLYYPLIGNFSVSAKIEFTEFAELGELSADEISHLEEAIKEEAQKHVEANPELQEKSLDQLLNGDEEPAQEQQQESTVEIHNHIITHPIELGNSLTIFIEVNPLKRISRKDPISSPEQAAQIVKKV